MKKWFVIIPTIVILLYFFKKEDVNTKGKYLIDSNIKKDYEKYLASQKDKIKDTNKLPSIGKIEFYEDNKLAYGTKGFEALFPIFCTWEKDTLLIGFVAGIDNYESIGVKIIQNQAFFTHSLEGSFKRFTLHKLGFLSAHLNLPCEEAKIILSEKPIKNSKKPFYGYIEFTSIEFYESLGNEYYSKDLFPQINRFKRRTKMKIYFKAISFQSKTT